MRLRSLGSRPSLLNDANLNEIALRQAGSLTGGNNGYNFSVMSFHDKPGGNQFDMMSEVTVGDLMGGRDIRQSPERREFRFSIADHPFSFSNEEIPFSQASPTGDTPTDSPFIRKETN